MSECPILGPVGLFKMWLYVVSLSFPTNCRPYDGEFKCFPRECCSIMILYCKNCINLFFMCQLSNSAAGSAASATDISDLEQRVADLEVKLKRKDEVRNYITLLPSYLL